MKALDQLKKELRDIRQLGNVSEREIIFENSGMQVLVVERDEKFEIAYEEALHVPKKEICDPNTAPNFIRRLLARTHLQRISPTNAEGDSSTSAL